MRRRELIAVLSRDCWVVTRMVFCAFAVHVSDGLVDRGFEAVGIDKGPVSQVVALEIAPGEFDGIELGRIAGPASAPCWASRLQVKIWLG